MRIRSRRLADEVVAGLVRLRHPLGASVGIVAPDPTAMQTLTTQLNGPVLVAPAVHGDERGFFVETFRESELEELGMEARFVQDNHSRSRQGIVRGMHFQPGQAKLVRCARGAILDVLVDIRIGSPQFGEWEAFTLDDVTHRQIYVPEGFAHGFCVLSELADVVYKVSTYYDPSAESGFAFNDSGVGIEWPDAGELLASARDREAPSLAELTDSLPFRYAVD
jgi:dTDP-4-dehydrorhamnose 3,5-epimerase